MVFADAGQVGTYRKKPTQVEARFVVEDRIEEIAAWCGGSSYVESRLVGEETVEQSKLYIDTLEGTMAATPGEDWVIKGTHGEFYPIKDEIFRANYEPVS